MPFTSNHICFFGVVALFFACAWTYTVPSGQLTLSLPSTQPSPYLRLVPESRLAQHSEFREITAEPVYLDIRTPGTFERATFAIVYSNPNADQFRFGGRLPSGQDRYDFIDLHRTETPTHRAEFSIDLSALEYKNNRYRFAFSLPDRPLPPTVRIYDITVQLKRPSLFESLKQKVAAL